MRCKASRFIATAFTIALGACIEVKQPLQPDNGGVSNEVSETCDSEGACKVDTACGSSEGFCFNGQCIAVTEACSDSGGNGCSFGACGADGTCIDVPNENGICVAQSSSSNGRCGQDSVMAMDPVDICDESGSCVDRPAAPERDNSFANRLTSDKWWTVMLNRKLGSDVTRAGLVEFEFDNDGGDWAFESDTYATSLPNGDGPNGSWCVDAHGGLALAATAFGEEDFSINHVGQIAKKTQAFSVVSTNIIDNLIVAIQPYTVDVTSINGSYGAVWVRGGTDNGNVQVGQGRFVDGVIIGGGFELWGVSDSLSTLGKPGEVAFGTPNNDGIYLATLTTSDGRGPDRGSERPIELRGAMTENANIILMVEATNNPSSIGNGLLMLVKTTNPIENLDGWWSTTQLVKPPGDLDWLAIPAIFSTVKGNIVSGLFGTDISVWDEIQLKGYIRSGSLEGDGTQRFVLNAATDGVGRRWTGLFASGGDFGFFVPSTPGTPVASPDDQPTNPAFPGIGFIMRRPDR